MIIERQTPTGTLYFNEGSHRYYKEVDGKKKYYPSVTGYTGIINKPGLIYWAVGLAEDNLISKLLAGKVLDELDIYEAGEQHTKFKQDAGDIGTQIHDWIDQWLNGLDPEIPDHPNVQTGITSFLTYQQENKIEWLDGEQIVCSEKYGFGGRYDRKCKIDGKLYMVDFKSSNQLSEDYAIQTALYQIAEEEITGEKFDGRLVIRFAKETEDEYLARMEKKNDKRRKLGKKPSEIKPYAVFEPKFYLDNEADKQAAIACVTLQNRLKALENA
jgi:hypothetical protein